MPKLFDAIALIGPPGVGKGTQGQVLGQLPGFLHHSSGDVFRSLDKDSELGKTFLSYSTRGELVPDELTIEIWRADLDKRIDRGEFDPARDVVILDGIPRNPAQASMMQQHVRPLGVIHLVVSNEQELIDRLKNRAQKQGRPDDADEAVIKRRLEIYEDATRPLLEHYDSKLIHDVDALGSPIAVAQRVLAAVERAVSSGGA